MRTLIGEFVYTCPGFQRPIHIEEGDKVISAKLKEVMGSYKGELQANYCPPFIYMSRSGYAQDAWQPYDPETDPTPRAIRLNIEELNGFVNLQVTMQRGDA